MARSKAFEEFSARLQHASGDPLTIAYILGMAKNDRNLSREEYDRLVSWATLYTATSRRMANAATEQPATPSESQKPRCTTATLLFFLLGVRKGMQDIIEACKDMDEYLQEVFDAVFDIDDEEEGGETP